MKKTAVNTDNLQETPWFNWGVHLKNVKEVLHVTGTSDYTFPDGVTQFPGDPVNQAKQLLIYLEEVYTKAGFSKQDIVHVDWAVTKDVSQEQAFAVLGVWEQFIADMDIKPAAGIWKHVHSLAVPEMLVEFQLTLAR